MGEGVLRKYVGENESASILFGFILTCTHILIISYIHISIPCLFTERERKHFPHLTNNETQTRYKARGRRYIPHGYGDDYEYTPHAEHIDVKYSE